jgi:pimeloyl-ACP methyl ester carboxylesterase
LSFLVFLRPALALLFFALTLAATVAARTYWYERTGLAPSRHRVARPEATELRNAEDVAFQGAGDTSVHGWLLPSRDGATIVLTHGSGADRTQVVPLAATLVRGGFGVLLFDWPGHGESEGFPGYGEPEREALSSALDFLTSREVGGRIGVFGFSLGAWIVAQVAPLDSRVGAVVLEGAPTDLVEQTRHEYRRWGPLAQWSALLALRGTGVWHGPYPSDTLPLLAPRPLLIIAGVDDTSVPPSMAERLFRAAREPKELWIVPGANHGEAWRVAGREYEERVTRFFAAALSITRLPDAQGPR